MTKPNRHYECLFHQASMQAGYFTARQAVDCGLGYDSLSYHVGTGRYVRVDRGVYRLRDYPPSLHEEVMVAWLSVGQDDAVVTHESALELHELSDIIPRAIHLTVPRRYRSRRKPSGAELHTTIEPLTGEQVVILEGIRVASPERAIADSAAAGAGPEQIEMAVAQGLDRGITTPRRLRNAAAYHGLYVQNLIERSISIATTA